MRNGKFYPSRTSTLAVPTNFLQVENMSCFIDFRKTFDSIDHNILQKLAECGFRGPILEIILEILDNFFMERLRVWKRESAIPTNTR